jgi:hypothetical protein
MKKLKKFYYDLSIKINNKPINYIFALFALVIIALVF